MPHQQGGVVIFWDMDKCFIHNSISGHRIVDEIRELSQHFGTMKSFRGYGQLMALGAPDSLRRRLELQASGVSLVDCPTINRRSISSKTMIVDMLLHAADNPPPVTFLIIAGGNDFTYAISKLRLRRYEVVLVCPQSLGGQLSLASIYVDWQDVFNTDLVIVDNSEKSTRNVQHRQRSRSADDTEASAAVINQGSDLSVTEPPCNCDFALRNHAPGLPAKQDLSGPPPLQVQMTGSCRKGTLSSAATGISPAQIIPQPSDKEEQEFSLSCIASGGLPRASLATPSLFSLSPAPTPSSENLRPSSQYPSSELPWQAGKQTIDKEIDIEPLRFYHSGSKPLSPINFSTVAISPNSPTMPFLPQLGMKSFFSSSAYATSEWTNSRFPANSGRTLSTSQISLPLSEISSNTVVPLSPEPSTPRVRATSVQSLPSPAH